MVTVRAAAIVGSPPLRDADYWQFADWLQVALDRLWNESHHTYTTDSRLTEENRPTQRDPHGQRKREEDGRSHDEQTRRHHPIERVLERESPCSRIGR